MRHWTGDDKIRDNCDKADWPLKASIHCCHCDKLATVTSPTEDPAVDTLHRKKLPCHLITDVGLQHQVWGVGDAECLLGPQLPQGKGEGSGALHSLVPPTDSLVQQAGFSSHTTWSGKSELGRRTADGARHC